MTNVGYILITIGLYITLGILICAFLFNSFFIEFTGAAALFVKQPKNY